VCSGKTNHVEVVRVMFDPALTSYRKLLDVFWSSHDPTIPTEEIQYQSTVFYYGEEQKKLAEATRDAFQKRLNEKNRGDIKTVIAPAKEFYFAEDNHQQYMAKNPEGICPLDGTGCYVPEDLVAV